ncbi:uncharacterized protein N7498_001196 [Penicillium cinerascens]|uniref:glycogenin glucosyltransferase n=1 Tax=Penicillium cinerascens TaxID=70096 RepID=A0A9W9NFU2_9EURO|nr:uncharacterized protein N7498_001196 [Penicillium cinerascens]KAJ5219097.1 hypothetical protein N7498_001196 [Penicillium cinerascens]
MMESERRAVYCTLLLSDNYLPGAMILAHSLRDNGTKARLVALFTPDTLQTATVNELRTVYDELIPVRELVNGTPANLWLMNRPDLIATFTKIELWRLTQFDRIVYIDCDVLASRAPDELLSLEVDFAAVPDVGWPDIFNSGLMVLRPNMQDYYALKALAERGISFDGADQGLLNMHFRDWHRLSFTYNCTPSANYQYIPAYRHFQSTISLIHFIGSQKPWNLPRQVVPQESPYNQLLGQWWAVYDRHYRPPFVSIRPPPQSVQQETYSAKAPTHEQWPEPYHVHHVKEHAPVSFHRGVQRDEDVAQLVSMTHEQTQPWQPSHNPDQGPATSRTMPVLSAVPQYVRGEEHVSTFIPPLPHIPASVFHALQQSHEGWQEPPKEQEHPQEQEHHQQEHHDQTHDAGHIYQPQPSAPTPPLTQLYQPPRSPSPQPPTFEAPKAEWDASREPPPLNTKPEGISLQERTYSMSEDTNLFRPPPSYPEAPKNMYYQVPETKPEPQKVTKLFPWESHAPKPTRVFAQELPVPTVSSEDQSTPTQIKESDAPPETPTLRSQYGSPTESWDTYTRSNVWDEDPHIQKYIESMQQVRHGRTQVISGSSQSSTSQGSASSSFSGRRPSIKLTDFPTAVERPSLPVTPAPVQPGAHEEASAEITLPTAEGVPDQEDWVGVTVDAFSQILRATYLLWQYTESSGPVGRAAPSAVGSFGEFRLFA